MLRASMKRSKSNHLDRAGSRTPDLACSNYRADRHLKILRGRDDGVDGTPLVWGPRAVLSLS